MKIPLVFELIKGLTKNEKQYFIKQSNLHIINNENKYVAIFHAYCSMETYDEKELCKQVKIKNTASNIASMNSYLLHQLFDVLLAYETNHSVDNQLLRWMQIIKLLADKQHFHSASIYWRKAFELAQRFDKLIVMVELYDINNFIYFSSQSKFSLNEIKSYIAEHKQALKKFEFLQLSKSLFVSTRLYLKLDYSAYDYKEIEGFLASPIVAISEEQSGFFIRYNVYVSCLSLLNILKRNDEAYVYCQKLLQLWLEFEYLVEENYSEYIRSLGNITSTLLVLNKLDEALDIFNLKPNNNYRNKLQEASYKMYKWNRILFINNQKNEYKKNISLLKEIETEDTKLVPFMNISNIIITYSNVMIAYFLIEDYDKAYLYFNKILDYKSYKLRANLIDFSLRFSLLILLENKNKIMFFNQINTVYHTLYSNKKLTKFDKLYLQLMRELEKTTSKTAQKRLFETHLADVLKMENLKKNLLFTYFSYEFWIQSKIEGMKYTDYRLHLACTLAASTP